MSHIIHKKKFPSYKKRITNTPQRYENISKIQTPKPVRKKFNFSISVQKMVTP